MLVRVSDEGEAEERSWSVRGKGSMSAQARRGLRGY
jgi:hypothetical protein